MTGSLAYRRHAAAILRGDVPEKYTRILPHITGDRVLEIGSAEGVLALLLAREDFGAKPSVTALEMRPDRHATALKLRDEWFQRFRFRRDLQLRHLCGAIGDRLDLLDSVDTLVAVRMVYYLRDDIDAVFAEIAKRVPTVVLCGNRNRADAWRGGRPHQPLGEFNRYASREGMRDLLERHGYRVSDAATDGDEIVVGVVD